METNPIEAAQLVINRGQRIQVLLELLCSEIGNNDYTQFWKDMKRCEDEYAEGLEALRAAIELQKSGVSVSNY